MYYHILVKKSEDIIYQSDINKEELEDITRDYNYGDFQVDGYFLNKKDISRFQIFESNLSIVDIINEKQIEINYCGLTEDVIFYHTGDYKFWMKDVTRKMAGTKVKSLNVESTNKFFSNNVFIVHGHDDALKNEVESFIKDLNLNPIILHKKASAGSTILEKIENHVNESSYGITLYSPCDVGGKNEINLKARARQNVVFEHGFLIGRLGRDKTCAIVKSDIEKPNDISGLVYIPHDKNEGWKIQLFRELKSVFNNIVFPA